MLPDFLQQLLQSQEAGESSSPQEGSGWASLLRSLFEKEGGGTAEKPAGGLGGLIQAILGEGETMDLGGQPDLAPFTEALAERFGISTRLASIIMTFAAGLLLAVLKRQGSGTAEKPAAQPAAAQPSAASGEAAPGGLNLDYLLDEAELVRSGAAARLAQRTGLEEAVAAKSLSAALALLLGRRAPQSAPRRGRRKKQAVSPAFDLKSLLDDWR